MRYYNNLFKLFLVLLFIFSINTVNIYAQETDSANQNISTTNDEGISPYSEVTGYIYKDINGVRYKRLWSYTYNHWIDPYWTPCD